MRWTSLLALPLCLFLACHASPEITDTTTGVEDPPERTPLAQRLDDEVHWLADDAREGRRAGTPAGRISAAWIAEQLAALRLEPAGEPANGKPSWFQSFEVGLDPRDGGRSHLTLLGQAPETLPALPLFCSEAGQVRGRIVDCGFGIEDAEHAWDDFAGKNLTGKLARITRGTPPSPAAPAAPAAAPTTVANPHTGETQLVAAGDGWGSAGSIFTKVMNAKRHGAIGVVLVPKDASEELLTFDAGHGARAGIPSVMLSWDGAQRLAQAGAEREVELSADVIREKGEALNVLARLPGQDGTHCVVIGAHYDHLGFGGSGSLAPEAKHAIHNGADDNASGTAAVIEIARALKAAGTPPCDVIVALWSGEELGLLGSEYWAQHPTVEWSRVKANLNLDMVGRADNGKLQVLGAGTSSSFASWMKDAGLHSGLALTVSLSGQALGGSSDHQTFLKRGVPALHLFSGLHADYHRPSDDADKFESRGAAAVVALGTELAQRMAQAPALDFIEPKLPEGERQVTAGGFKVRLGSIPNYAYDGVGVLIDGASQGTPAERAGLIRGDILLQLGDVKLANVYDLTYALGRFKPGDVVVVKFRRDGQEQETRVTLAAPTGEVR